MQTFIQVLTFIGMIAVIAVLIIGIITLITLIIGLVKKDYKYFKQSLKILLYPVGVFIVTILLYALGRALSQ